MSFLHVLLLLTLALCSLSARNEVLPAAQIVLAVKRHFFSSCVFVLYSNPDLQVAGHLSQLQRELSLLGLPTASVAVTSGRRLQKLRCRSNRPLYIVSAASNIHEQVLEQVFSDAESRPCFPRWLLLSWELYSRVNVPYHCEVLVTKPQGDTVELREMYSVGPHLPLQRNVWGVWSYEEGLKGPQLSFYNRRSDLQGVKLRVAAGHDPPFEHVHLQTDGSIVAQGFFVKVWKELEIRMNFTTEMVFAPFNTGGSPQRNGSWSGLIGMIHQGEANASLNRITITTKRQEAIAYTLPIFLTKACLTIETPRNAVLDWHVFLAPFSLALWLTVLGSLLLFICLLQALQTLSRLLLGWTERFSRFADSCMTVWATFCGQGTEIHLDQWPGRLVFWVAAITAVTLRAAYSANLTAFLTSLRPQIPFTSLEGLLSDGTYGMGVIARSGLLTIFMNTSDRVTSEVFQRFIEPANEHGLLPPNISVGLAKVCTDRYAFMTLVDYILAGREQTSCEMTILPHASFPLNMAMLFAKHHPYLGLVNHNLLELQRLGVLKRLLVTENSPVFSDHEFAPMSINMQGAMPLLVMWAVGIGVAVAVWLTELCNSSLK